jgi:hypothetical protein
LHHSCLRRAATPLLIQTFVAGSPGARLELLASRRTTGRINLPMLMLLLPLLLLLLMLLLLLLMLLMLQVTPIFRRDVRTLVADSTRPGFWLLVSVVLMMSIRRQVNGSLAADPSFSRLLGCY